MFVYCTVEYIRMVNLVLLKTAKWFFVFAGDVDLYLLVMLICIAHIFCCVLKLVWCLYVRENCWCVAVDHACNFSDFFADFRLFKIFWTIFENSPELLRKFLSKKCGGGVSWLDSEMFFSCDILVLHWKVQQIPKNHKSTNVIIVTRAYVLSVETWINYTVYTREKNTLDSWISCIILLRCALCFSE